MDKKIIVRLQNVSKKYDDKTVIENLNLDIYNGEFLTILGPSGCGKTTILRLIAGFETADSGNIYLNDKIINDVAPNKREVHTVFQNYALFPHMNVFNNIAFGLKMHNVPKKEIEERVNEVLRMVKLEDFGSRKPHQLSGGQQQRVSLARAIVNKPLVLLLDEPLSALDANLRQNMQKELKQLQRALNITFVLVTHDREEALSMADRVVVMNHGDIVQMGTPKSIYEEPESLFVASFIGEINILNGEVINCQDGYIDAKVEGRNCTIKTKKKLQPGDDFKLLLRPEDMRIEKLSENPDTEGLMLGKVEMKIYKGATLDTIIRLQNNKVIKASEFFDEEYEDLDYSMNEKVSIGWVSGWEVILTDERT